MKYEDEENCKTEKVLCINVFLVRITERPPVLNFVRLQLAGEIQKSIGAYLGKHCFVELIAVPEKKHRQKRLEEKRIVLARL